MSTESKLQSLFNDAANYIDKIVGKYVKNYQTRVSKHLDRDGYLISLTANCKSPGCRYVVMANISSTEEQWSTKLVNFFIQRAEFHAKSWHRIQTDFLKIPNTPYKPNKGGFRGNG